MPVIISALCEVMLKLGKDTSTFLLKKSQCPFSLPPYLVHFVSNVLTAFSVAFKTDHSVWNIWRLASKFPRKHFS